MNQINGYCQIELPDRIALDALNSEGVTLTDAEVKPIIKALNLDQVLAGNAYDSYINAWLNKPVIVKAYVPTEEDGRDVKSIFYASIVSTFSLSDSLSVQIIYDGNGGLRYFRIDIAVAAERPSIYMNWEIKVFAHQITTTNIQ